MGVEESYSCYNITWLPPEVEYVISDPLFLELM